MHTCGGLALPRSENEDKEGASLGAEVRTACLRLLPGGDSRISTFSTSLISTNFFFSTPRLFVPFSNLRTGI